MRVETGLGDRPWDEVARQARLAEEMGFDGIGAPELKRDPFLTVAVAARETKTIRLETSVAIAFPRSPMVVAYESFNLQEMSGGRFVLGLGTQVKGHIERRFSTTWDSPGPRLRDYVQSLRAIWDTWQNGTPLRHDGPFYQFSLMTPEFSPPPLATALPKVQIAAVNAYNIRLAGELCDGLRVHPFSTAEYTRDVIWPNVMAGAAKSGRSLDDFELSGTGFIATGPDAAAVAKAREDARYRIAFYASTRTYLPVLEHHGWEDLNPKLRDLIAQNRWEDLPTVVPDDVLDTFCVSGTWDTIADRVDARLSGLIDTISVSAPDERDPRFDAALAGFKRIPGRRDD
ncbi:MAG: TIGR03617 family F420-dependent LLM class oxidoreductase [Thermomicrobiales bacterium]